MRTFKHPIEQYKIAGNMLRTSGEFSGFEVDILLHMASAEQIRTLEEFFISQGWMK